MGANKPLRGFKRRERRVRSGMKYGARWSGAFVIARGRTDAIVGAAQQKSERRCQHVYLHVCAEALASALDAWQQHMAWCVFMSVRARCACESGSRWKGRGCKDSPGRCGVSRMCRRRLDVPAVVQEMWGQHGDEDVLPVHGEEQGSSTVGTCS